MQVFIGFGVIMTLLMGLGVMRETDTLYFLNANLLMEERIDAPPKVKVEAVSRRTRLKVFDAEDMRNLSLEFER